MYKGILFALEACFVWAFIYIVPQFIPGFSSIEIALGRYFVFGIISLLLFWREWSKGGCRFPKIIWFKSLYFALICTIGYYTFLVLAIRYSSTAICAMVLGISPITIALYGNWKQKEISFKKLILPSALILIGLTILNFPNAEDAVPVTSHIFGLICSVCALAAWTWYVEANSRFLKENPTVPSSDWCTLIGIGTLFWVIIFTIILALFFNEQLHFSKYLVFDSDLQRFIIGSLILGIFCSWIAEYLWNRASLLLPISLAGQLTIFETGFALLLVYIIDQRLPYYSEILGISIQLVGILYGIKLFSKKKLLSVPG
jgi:drug/metabolite transporter (DMT)-like permease